MGIVVGAIRATVTRSTGFTPNRMMLGRELMMPLDLMLGNDGEEFGREGTFRDGWVVTSKSKENTGGGPKENDVSSFDGN